MSLFSTDGQRICLIPEPNPRCKRKCLRERGERERNSDGERERDARESVLEREEKEGINKDKIYFPLMNNTHY